MARSLSEPLAELIDRIERRYEKIFDQVAPEPGEGVEELDDNFQERARGFKKAADLITASIIENQNLLYYEMIPAAVFLYRHSIELNLKSMRTQLTSRVSEEFKFRRNHNLLELWRPIERYMTQGGFNFEDGLLHYRVACSIKELSDLDFDGQLFRYPDCTSPAALNWIRINFENLQLSATEVDLLAFGFHELIIFFESVKRYRDATDNEPQD